ncbi:MAG: hypothetical protein KME30_20715 [Iphinoe sp. HA4291-MV1]|jgi:hypothetical protein|nr:hypothetical protein [Iphinoe sp. HA4291-MV1]
MNTQTVNQLPIPAHFNSEEVGFIWRVPYQQRAKEARAWVKKYLFRCLVWKRVKAR